jgi:hypothetical protein
MEVTETLRFAGFDVLEQAGDHVWRGKALGGEKNCALADQKAANGCILNRTVTRIAVDRSHVFVKVTASNNGDKELQTTFCRT